MLDDNAETLEPETSSTPISIQARKLDQDSLAEQKTLSQGIDDGLYDANAYTAQIPSQGEMIYDVEPWTFDLLDPLMGMDPGDFLFEDIPADAGELHPSENLRKSGIAGVTQTTAQPNYTAAFPQQIHEGEDEPPGWSWPMSISGRDSNFLLPDPRTSPLTHKSHTQRPDLHVTEVVRTRLLIDFRLRLGPLSPVPDIPNATTLDRCLHSYLKTFHVHFPLVHLPSLDLTQTPSPLLFTMCAIGALYKLERKVAALLCQRVEQSLSTADDATLPLVSDSKLLEDCLNARTSSTAQSTTQMWLSQTLLLLSFFTAFTGKPQLVRKALQRAGWLAIVSTIRFASSEYTLSHFLGSATKHEDSKDC